MSQRLRILVLCGGPSSEHDVSLKTADMVMRHLDVQKYKSERATIQKNGKWRFGSSRTPISLNQAIRRLSSGYDCVFIAMHGAFGEDGKIQALLESIGLPYTGSGVLSSALAINKHMSNMLFAVNGLNVPTCAILEKGNSTKTTVTFPVVVKPINGGSSVGVSIVKTKKDLVVALRKAFRENPKALVQRYIRGREFTCGVLEGTNGKPFPLPPTEIIPRISSFFDYRAKYKTAGSYEVTPPRLPTEKIKRLQRLAVQAHTLLGCKGMSRSDFILSGTTFYILETNTIPGLTEASLLPQAASAASIAFPELIDMIISSALRKQ